MKTKTECQNDRKLACWLGERMKRGEDKWDEHSLLGSSCRVTAPALLWGRKQDSYPPQGGQSSSALGGSRKPFQRLWIATSIQVWDQALFTIRVWIGNMTTAVIQPLQGFEQTNKVTWQTKVIMVIQLGSHFSIFFSFSALMHRKSCILLCFVYVDKVIH